MEHDFQGDTRELENIIQHAFVLCHGELIELCHLPLEPRVTWASTAARGSGR